MPVYTDFKERLDGGLPLTINLWEDCASDTRCRNKFAELGGLWNAYLKKWTFSDRKKFIQAIKFLSEHKLALYKKELAESNESWFEKAIDSIEKFLQDPAFDEIKEE